MIRSSYKSLDRPFDFFGLKGKWVIIFLIGTGAGILLGIILGTAMTSAMGIATAIIGGIASFVVCLMKQQSISDRKIGRSLASGKCRVNVTRHEQLSRILLPNEDYERVKKAREKSRNHRL